MKKVILTIVLALFAGAVFGLSAHRISIVEASGGNQTAIPVSISLTTYFDPENIITTTVAGRTYGELLSLESSVAAAPAGAVTYDFLFWEENGTIANYPLDHPFVLTGENVLKAVFSPSDKHVVAFVDANGKILKLDYVTNGADATPPATLPDKPGYAVSGWSASYAGVTADVVTFVQYAKVNADAYYVTVVHGTGGGETGYNGIVTLIAETPASGMYFHHWESDGKVVGYGTPFSFTVFADATVTAVYAATAPADLPRVVLSADLGLRTAAFKRTHLARYVLPAGYTFVECGFLTHADRVASLSIDTAGAVRRRSLKQNAATREYLMSFAAGTALTVRAYLITLDGSGTLVTVYDEAAYEVENGGFEQGDLSGWTSYGIWKDETNLTSFREERVVSTAYYGSSGTDLYNRDGIYHFGVYADPYVNANKDLNQERMGMLRSTDFVLSGSGYVGFKLGGGKNDSAAYLAVHDAETDAELARYSNRHFNNTTLSGTANAEAYMFQYYADLSAYLGRTLYVLLVDAASHEWNVLACDSVDTYLPVAPTLTTDTTAQNIVPAITGAGAATNAITNGDLTANLTGWQNPDGVFQIGNGGAISSVGGNAAVGSLRSPAFKIGTNRYLRFDFAGAIRYDKQVFVLVKEVGTNLEALRLVRRADQASRADGGEFKTHWYDLGGLDPAKEYYLEVIDNRDGDWGVAIIKLVSLVAAPLSDYQQAESAYYGLATVDAGNGEHRTPVATLDPMPDAGTWLLSATPGEDASDAIGLHYQTEAASSAVVYTTASDSYFQNATTVTVSGSSYSSSLSVVDGVTYGFSSRYLGDAAVTGLLPDTTYLWRVVNGGRVSPTRSFTTAPEAGTFRFLYLTDPQAESYAQTEITRALIGKAYALHDDYAFALLTGDIVEVGAAPLYWDRFFATGIGTTPILAVLGNHDYEDASRAITNTSFYGSMFNNPKNGISTRQNSSYYVVYGNALFVMLDAVTNADLASQQAWFASIVAAHRRAFVIVSMHYSLYGTYHDGDAATVTADWLATFDAAQVDLVLSGHDHMYARTPAMTAGAATGDPLLGTVYLIGGAGGYKYREVTSATNFSYYISPTVSTASVITVSATAITVETVNVAGTVVDTFTVPVKPAG